MQPTQPTLLKPLLAAIAALLVFAANCLVGLPFSALWPRLVTWSDVTALALGGAIVTFLGAGALFAQATSWSELAREAERNIILHAILAVTSLAVGAALRAGLHLSSAPYVPIYVGIIVLSVLAHEATTLFGRPEQPDPRKISTQRRREPRTRR